MTLSNWAKNEWLKPHQTSKQEISGLLSIVERELRDAAIQGISSDGKFNHAYRAALTLATALLYSAGYMPARGQSHHYRTIAALPLLLGDSAKADSEYLETCRVKRNAAEYDAANEVSDTEADELLEFASEYSAMIQGRLKKSGY